MLCRSKKIEHVLHGEEELLGVFDGVKVLLRLFCDKNDDFNPRNSMNSIQILAAVVIKDQKILCVQRGAHKHPYLANKWEFSGCKMEAGERLKRIGLGGG